MRYQYCAANKLRASLSRCSNAVKNLLFVPSARRIVARKSSVRGLYVCVGGLDNLKFNKTPLIYSASYFNLGRLGALSVCTSMYHNYGVISRRQAGRDCAWPIILGAGHCTQVCNQIGTPRGAKNFLRGT